MTKYLEQSTKHPKQQQVLCFILLFIFSFHMDTNRDNEKYKDNTSHHFWNGIKWLVIIFVISGIF